jgi:hypothetical protein
MEHPSRVTFEQIQVEVGVTWHLTSFAMCIPCCHDSSLEMLQADPSLLERDASVLAEFQAAPWLLPPRTKALNYAGVHQLDMLAELRSKPIGNSTKAITLLTFNAKFAVMTQNCSESLVTACW